MCLTVCLCACVHACIQYSSVVKLCRKLYNIILSRKRLSCCVTVTEIKKLCACRVGGCYFSKVTSYLLLITSSNVTRYSYILLCNSELTSNILHITF